MILWLAGFSWRSGVLRVVPATAVAFLIVTARANLEGYAENNRLIAEYLSVSPHIGRGASLFSYCRGGYLPGADFLRHADGYIGAERHAIVLRNYQVGARGFPFRRREKPPAAPDFVLIWSRGSASPGKKDDAFVLGKNYRLVWAAQGRLAMQLYENSERSAAPGSTGSGPGIAAGPA